MPTTNLRRGECRCPLAKRPKRVHSFRKVVEIAAPGTTISNGAAAGPASRTVAARFYGAARLQRDERRDMDREFADVGNGR
jgi:hypothetical protein